MKNEKLHEVIKTDIATLANITDIDEAQWLEEDAEALMEKHDLTADECNTLESIMQTLVFRINLRAVKAADEVVNKITQHQDVESSICFEMRDILWHDTYEGVAEALKKNMAAIAETMLENYENGWEF